MEQKYSPRPWKIERGQGFYYLTSRGYKILEFGLVDNSDDLEFIVQACNAHEDLRQACLDVKLSLGLISASPDVVDTLLHTVLGLNIQKLEVAIAKAEASHGN